MTEEIIQSMSLNKILIALLEHHKSLSVPAANFIGAENDNKELVVEYDETDSTFKFSLRSSNE